ncbi:MAG TPA: glycosyltransferase [Thermoanaerobaculia bacterium]
MLRDATIICFSGVDWTFNRQIPQETAHGFAQFGNRVLYVENTGARTVAWRDLPRLLQRLRNWWRARGGTAPVAGVDVFSPLLIPLPYAPAAISINTAAMLKVIRRWLAKQRSGPLVVINFLPTPAVRQVIDALEPDAVVYYRTDRMSESTPAARMLAAFEQQSIAEADVVWATAPQLYEEIVHLNGRVEMLEAGVRSDEFAEAWRRRDERHATFDGIAGPIAGFAGSLRDATDLALIEEAATLAPDITFVLAGPRFADLSGLQARPNVRLVGTISSAEVPRYFARFDVGILPYVLDSFTAGIMPMKLKEYLAAGLPIVSTGLPAVKSFAARHPGLITFAGDARSFVDGLRSAIENDSAEAVARRLELAKTFDWSRQVARMGELVEDVLLRRSRAAS